MGKLGVEVNEMAERFLLELLQGFADVENYFTKRGRTEI